MPQSFFNFFEVWDALLTAQLVDESNSPFVRAPIASVEGRSPSSPLHNLKVVPTIDLNTTNEGEMSNLTH